MRSISLKVVAAYLLILPAVYTMVMLVFYQLTGNISLLSLTPLKSIFPAIFVLIMLPSVAFMMNTSYKSYAKQKGQSMLSLLIMSVWMFNVVLLISACSS